MKIKDIKQITEEVIDESNLQELSMSAQRKISGTVGAAVTGAAVGGVVALYWAAYKALRSVTKKMDTETDIMKKAALKKVVAKQKIKVAKLKAKVKTVKETYELTNDDMRIFFNEGAMGKAAAKLIAKAKFLKGPSKKALGKMNYAEKGFEKTITGPIRNAYRKQVGKKAAAGATGAAVGVGAVKGGAIANSISKNTQKNQVAVGVGGAAVGVATLAYGLKKLYDKFKSEKDPQKKTALKAKINKAKTKIKAKKAVKESYNFNENDLVEIFGESYIEEFGGKVGGYLDRRKEAKRMKDLKIQRGVERAERKSRINTSDEKIGDRIMSTRIAKNAQNTWDTNKDVQTGTKVAAAGVAGVLAYKLYKKLKEKYSEAKDPKQKAKIKKQLIAQKAKLKK